ncbi:exo-alpha-sialidase [Echinicola sp. 20G]|uniref:sialidase family protein n=1 Tax=Echinicola sp. 20G TaxID=2781961 RepID=UPI001F368543|nr:sialidase family protein [Echinicola sp. 20G]
MKKVKEIRFVLLGSFMALLFFGRCTSQILAQESVVQVKVKAHYIPLIKGKINDVISIDFKLEKDITLDDLMLRIEGGDAMESLIAYELIGEGKDKKRIPIAELVELKNEMKLRIDKEFLAGDHNLVISIQPKKSASLLGKVDVSLERIDFKNRDASIEQVGINKPLRLATSLRTAGDDGIAAFRIPGLVTTAKGSLIGVYDVRYNSSVDLQEDVDVGMSRSTDGGKSWEPMQIIMDMGEWGGKPQIENGIGDPAILVDPMDNTIYVLALWMHGKPGKRAWFSSGQGFSPEETGQLMLVKSIDDGRTWSKPLNITSQIKKKEWKLMFDGPGKGITMKDGTLVFAGQFKDENDMPHSTIIYSKDKGETWHIGTGAKTNTTEAQVVELKDGSLMLNMRDNRGGSRSISVTKDLGKTWTEHSSSRSALVEPVCMGSLISYSESRTASNSSYLFFSNPAATDGRYNMTIKFSENEGRSWSEGLLLDGGHGWGYSCLTVIDDQHLGILYESSQAHMTFQIVPIPEIVKAK